MSEITGVIHIPFHGENGKSAYEIAVRHGYEGTEAEWIESLGFIPDGSIGEKKLADALIGKLKEYETFIGEVFEEKSHYEEIQVNEYNAEAEVYNVPYRLIGVMEKYRVRYPKLGSSITVFDESNADLWSTESSDYRLSKIEVSDSVGKGIRIYGVANSLPAYPCAFFTDEEGFILERCGNETNTVYGYSLKEGYTSGYNFTEAIETIVPERAKFLYIMGRRFSSGGIEVCDAKSKAELLSATGFIPNEKYKLMQSPLWGKKLYVDGDSICYGNGYTGGFGKIIADKYNMELINNGVGGATICQNTGNEDVKYYNKDGTRNMLDWEKNDYYLGLTYSIPSAESNYQDGFRVKLTEEIYNNGFGVYPTYYKFVNGEIVKQPYTETMPTNCKWYVKFDIPTYDGNTVEKYVAMWAYPQTDGSYTTPETTGNRWLWEAYKSGFASAHEKGYARIAPARHWLSAAVEDIDTDADYIVFEGGINDYLLNRRLGEITQDMTSAVDTTTVIGGMEHICRQMLEKGIGKKLIYVITHKSKEHSWTKNRLGGVTDYKTWADYHDAIVSVLKKYSIPCVDLFTTSSFNTSLEEYNKLTVNSDGVHPTKEGYELFYVPQIVNCMERI